MSDTSPPAAPPAPSPEGGPIDELVDELVREALAPYVGLPPAVLAEIELSLRDALACHPGLRPLMKALAPPVVATSDVLDRESGERAATTPPRRAGGGEP